MTAPLPDDLHSIRAALAEVEQLGSRGPALLRDAYAALRESDRLHEVARAKATLGAREALGERSTVAERDAWVLQQTIGEREVLDDADIAHRYVASRVKELSSRQSSIQTRASLIKSEMSLAGVAGP